MRCQKTEWFMRGGAMSGIRLSRRKQGRKEGIKAFTLDKMEDSVADGGRQRCSKTSTKTRRSISEC